MMKLQSKSRQIFLASVFVCVFTPQVHAGFSDDIKNKTVNATKQVMTETVNEVVGDKPEPLPTPQKTEPLIVAKSSEAQKQTVDVPIADFDIVGFRVGMSPDDVREKLLGYRDDFKIQVYNSIPASQNKKSEVIKQATVEIIQNVDANNLPEHVYEIRAYVQGGSESFEFHFLKPPASNTLYSINRSLTFTKDNAPEDNKITEKLKAKYGQVFSEESSYGGIKWIYDDNGSLRREPDRMFDQYCTGRLDKDMFPMLDTTGGCGTLVSAKLNLVTGSNFVRSLSVTIVDRKAHLSNKKESTALIAQIKDIEMKSQKRDVLEL